MSVTRAFSVYVRRLPDVLLACAVIAIATLSVIPTEPSRPPAYAPRNDNNVVFSPIPILAPNTPAVVAAYTSRLETEIFNLPRDTKDLKTGFLEYVPSQHMLQGRRERVSATVALTKATLAAARAATFKEVNGATAIEPIDVSETMGAKLSGSPGLGIRELSTFEQLVRPNEATTWNWEVTPVEYGDAELYLVLSLRTRTPDGYAGAKDLKPFVRPIHVAVDRAFSAQRFARDNLAIIVGLLTVATTLSKVPWRRVLGLGRRPLAFVGRFLLRWWSRLRIEISR